MVLRTILKDEWKLAQQRREELAKKRGSMSRHEDHKHFNATGV